MLRKNVELELGFLNYRKWCEVLYNHPQRSQARSPYCRILGKQGRFGRNGRREGFLEEESYRPEPAGEGEGWGSPHMLGLTAQQAP